MCDRKADNRLLELVPWLDSKEDGKIMEVLEKNKQVPTEACSKKLKNSSRLQTNGTYPLPKVAATRSSAFIKHLISMWGIGNRKLAMVQMPRMLKGARSETGGLHDDILILAESQSINRQKP